MTSAEAADAGEWRAVGTSPYGQCQSQGTLTVNVPPGYRPPDFLQPLQDVKVVEAEVLKLEAKVDGLPAVDIVWWVKNSNTCIVYLISIASYAFSTWKNSETSLPLSGTRAAWSWRTAATTAWSTTT